MKNLMLAGSFALVLAGCAASNGGGHVVGNSMRSAGKTAKMEKSSCGCGQENHEHKACACGDEEGGACGNCGTDQCSCGH